MKKKISLLLVDDNVDFRELMKVYIEQTEDIEVVGVASDGIEAIEKIIELRPDVITLDLIMPNLDGIGVLEKMNMMRLVKKPSVFVLSALGQDMLVRKAMDFGAAYFFLKPIDIGQLIKQIRQIFKPRAGNDFIIGGNIQEVGRLRREQSEYATQKDSSGTSHELEVEVTSLLYEAGVPPHMVGYRYLKAAIIYCVQIAKQLSSFTKELYPAIAAQFATSPQKVERAIRNCIEKAWQRTNHDTMDTLLGYSTSSSKSKPTNSEFIATMVERVKMLQRG